MNINEIKKAAAKKKAAKDAKIADTNEDGTSKAYEKSVEEAEKTNEAFERSNYVEERTDKKEPFLLQGFFVGCVGFDELNEKDKQIAAKVIAEEKNSELVAYKAGMLSFNQLNSKLRQVLGYLIKNDKIKTLTTPTPFTTAASIEELKKTIEILSQRDAQHGSPKGNITLYTKLATSYINHKKAVTDLDILMINILQKVARVASNKDGDCKDSLHDIAGYAAIAASLLDVKT